ncbi:MAG TPA: universal stress protein [Syntrophobacteria bacterium]|nr:universal stress protein [Syntrophobacteria bacterium]
MAQSLDAARKSIEGCVMLALSTFRKSEKAIDIAIEKSRKVKKLMLVYVADVNLARYLVDVEYGLFPSLKDTCEADLLKQHKEVGLKHVAEIAEKAGREGIEVKTHVEIGRFAIVCLDVVQKENPALIVTTRSQRPEWVKKFFGAPVDELIAQAGCPVIVV